MISISIVTYHTPLAELDTCLRSLASPAVRRIYIVDNARQREVEEWASGKKKIIYIPADNNGYGAGHNIAMRRELGLTDTRYHLVMNSDMQFSHSVISAIVDFMESHPDVGTLQPHMRGRDGEIQHPSRCLPTPADVLIRRFLPAGWFGAMRSRYLLTHLDDSLAWDIPSHQGSFMFLRKDALREVGLFDERFFMYAEDIDLTRRIHARYRTIYWPGATVIHYHRAASYHSVRMLLVHIVNLIRYFNKWGWIFDRDRAVINASISAYR
ncbi:MAG: glycosyltransferase family 2 protein [Paenibacillus sp.]|nr:glycosyltransferase family 2 protein [Paenibacillus sp.]